VWWFEIEEGDFDLLSLVVLLCAEEGGSNVCSGDEDVVLEEFGLQTLAVGEGRENSVAGYRECESFDFVGGS
jgi:hypothetical protein